MCEKLKAKKKKITPTTINEMKWNAKTKAIKLQNHMNKKKSIKRKYYD